jgi:signal transduction histidine kinase
MAAVGEMAAGVAHELNNPLTSVVGFTELVLDEMAQEVVHRPDLELVLREAHRARDVVRRLLDFARQSESVKTRGDLNEVVTDVLALVKHLLHTSGIQVETQLAKKIPWVYVDHNQVKQVLLNLTHNALHAMPDGGRLFISTSTHQRDGRGWATIEVRDTGLGIPPENIDRLFEPFFTTRSKDGGTGLGLAISYGIVTDQGGFIEVESKVGCGSNFKVWLPLEVSR